MENLDPQSILGTVVADRYRIDRRIGSGGFAWVYRAATPTDELVAIKVLRNEKRGAAALFEREVKVLKALPRNPHVPQYIDDGVTSEGTPFLVTEYFQGHTLMEEIAHRKWLEPRDAVELVAQLCQAFVGLHQLGVAHRDVKPENIILTSDDEVKLVDFGLIRDAQGILKLLEQYDPMEDPRVFSKELDRWTIVGTPEYMAPEQFSDAIEKDGSRVFTDTWSDVFSLGVILFELIAGRAPFPMRPVKTRKNLSLEIFRYMRWRLALTDDALPTCSELDDALESILHKTLRFDPRQRQPDAKALKTDLEIYLECGEGVPRSYGSHTIDMSLMKFDESEWTMEFDDDSVSEDVVPDRGAAAAIDDGCDDGTTSVSDAPRRQPKDASVLQHRIVIISQQEGPEPLTERDKTVECRAPEFVQSAGPAAEKGFPDTLPDDESPSFREPLDEMARTWLDLKAPDLGRPGPTPRRTAARVRRTFESGERYLAVDVSDEELASVLDEDTTITSDPELEFLSTGALPPTNDPGEDS